MIDTLVNECEINVYVASNMPYSYPFKLQHSGMASQRIRGTCDVYIADSDINNPDAGNEAVLDQSEDLNADYVIPADVIGDIEATEVAVQEFRDLYPSYRTNARMLHPVQPPHDEHLDRIDSDHICMGGLKDADSRTVIRALEHVKNTEREFEHVHLLGVASREVLSWLRDNPVVDSLDAATPENAAINSSILTRRLKQEPVNLPSGTCSSPLRYQLARYNALVLNMVMTPGCDAISNGPGLSAFSTDGGGL